MRKIWVTTIGFLFALCAVSAASGQDQKLLTLEECVKIALDRDLRLHSAVEGIAGSEFRRRAALTDFFPKWRAQYSYSRLNEAPTSKAGGREIETGTASNYNFSTTIDQPLFTGGLIDSTYRLEALGVDISRADSETVKRDVILLVREGYFNILAATKLLEVAEQNVKLLEAQLEVSKAFFEVGIVPKNDVLQAEVRVAQARQNLVRAERTLAVAKSSFNTLLRREIDAPVNLVDILDYKPFSLKFEESAEEAIKNRPEIRSAKWKIDQAKEAVRIARSTWFPNLSLAWSYYRYGDEPWMDGTKFKEPWSWVITGVVTWNFGDWGKVAFKVGENKVKVTQAEDSKTRLLETIILEVKEDYLNVLQAEKNIGVAEKATEQAEENLRMNEERYKYQVATQTEVLDAVTLLTTARVNYLVALTEFNIAKARLDRSMGKMFP